MIKKLSLFSAFGLFVTSLFFGAILNVHAGPGYTDGLVLKSPQHTSVYQYEGGKRHAFPNQNVYYTWHENFNNVVTISVAEMEAIELGDPMPIKGYTKLLKFPLNPKIYAVAKDGLINHLPDAVTAENLYGANWEDIIIELPEIYYLFYTKGDALDPVSDSTNVDTSVAFTCPSGTTAKSYISYGFGVCHDDAGSMVDANNYITFSASSDMVFPGKLDIVSGYDTVQDYINYLNFGISRDPLTADNMQGVEYNSFPAGTVDSNEYHLMLQNPDTKNIYYFHHPANGTDLENAVIIDFMDGLGDTFRFLE